MVFRMALALCMIGGIAATGVANETTIRRAPVHLDTVGYPMVGYGVSGPAIQGYGPSIVQNSKHAFPGATGCCETQPSCCDNVWAGFCRSRKTWCQSPAYGKLSRCGKSACGGCGKSACGGCGSGKCGGKSGCDFGYGFGMVAPAPCRPHGFKLRGFKHNLWSVDRHHHGKSCGCASCGGHWKGTYGAGCGYGYAKCHKGGHSHHYQRSFGGSCGCHSTHSAAPSEVIIPSTKAPVIESAPILDTPTLAPPQTQSEAASDADQHSAFRNFLFGGWR